MPLARLLDDAIHYARHGMPVTRSQSLRTSQKRGELEHVPGFTETFLDVATHETPLTGTLFKQPRLAATLEH